jgi:transcriptional regulator GlxA family with amidase domain
MLGIEVDATFEEMTTPDVVVFPGGHGTRALMHDERVLDWVRTAHETTAAGVSSGIDMALRLVEILVDRTAAEASQLMIEYDPQPPFDAGSTVKASAEVVERVAEYAAARK